MAVQLVDNFDLSSKKPLDSRAYWETLEALQANKTILMPNGFLAYVEDKKCYYIMNCTNASDPSTYTWSEFKTGSTEGSGTTGPTYTAGDNIQISSDNKISAIIDLTNYYTKSQVDDLIARLQQIINNEPVSPDAINNNYNDNILEAITSSNIESWITNYIHSDSDKFNGSISCGSKVTINDGVYNAQWLVVGADTELNKGDTKLTTPHLSLIPVTNLGETVMNDSHTSSGAYVGSKMYKETIPKIVAALQKVLGDHLLARRVKLANSTDGNHSNSSAYYTVYANLLCERQIWGTSKYENSYDIGDDTEALPGFNNYKNNIYGSSDFWLRSVFGSSYFVFAHSDGSVNYGGAGYSRGVRPLITIG